MTYADGTAGHSGTDSSAERVEIDGPALSMRLRETEIAVRRRGYHGMTVVELEQIALIHHGRASSALTNLHKAGLIARTAHRRDGCKVYKALEFVEPHDTLETFVPRGKAQADKIAELEGRIADARLALLTGETSTHTLKILDGK
jgi:MarR family protein